jgi:hypothetical protein
MDRLTTADRDGRGRAEANASERALTVHSRVAMPPPTL